MTLRRPKHGPSIFGSMFMACLFVLALKSSFLWANNDPLSITIEAAGGGQETYYLGSQGATNLDGLNYPYAILLSKSDFDENKPLGGQSINLSALDPDIGDEHEFGLVAGTGGEDNAMFTLVGNELRSNATYDFEAKNTFSVLISATDISGLSVAKVFTITINDDRSEDFDNDGLTEAQEEDTYGTSDLDPDSDNDGLVDGPEVNIHSTNPAVADTDGDGMTDGWEHDNALNPLANEAAGDADGDQLSNLIEFQGGTNPQDADTDQDGFNDYAETLDGKDPTDRTSLPLPSPGVPERMNYAGVVHVDGRPFEGTGYFKFAFAEVGGNVLWTNDGTGGDGEPPTGAVQAPVSNGRYVLVLGDPQLVNMRALPSSVFTRNDVELRVWFSDGVNGFEQLSPNQRVASVAYSMVAGWSTNSLTARELSRPPEVLGVAPSGLADAPYVRSLYYVAAPTGQGISFNIRSVDPVVSYSITGLPSGLGLNSATGVISGTMPADAGAYEVKITASNGYGQGPEFTLYLVAE
ncbi:putative Ig domain-containing protein [Opitutales bacterium]|nr:putative Ig domain-containing protein [Opitutales bacterium]